MTTTRRMTWTVVLAAGALLACDGEPERIFTNPDSGVGANGGHGGNDGLDGGTDAGPADASPDGSGTLPPGAGDAGTVDMGPEDTGPAMGPTLTPCPEGWEARTDSSGVEYCEPWPDTVSPVQLQACPDGWRSVVEDDARFCLPYEGDRPRACLFHEAHFPGASRCEVLGSACPAGVFPDDLPSDQVVVFVDAAAAAGGDGSAGRPHASLDEVDFAALDRGTVVVLAEGTYASRVTVPSGVQLRGACVQKTVLVAAEPGRPCVTIEDASDVVVRDLSIRGSAGTAIEVRGGSGVAIEGVAISEGSGNGIFVEGTVDIELSEVSVRDSTWTEGPMAAIWLELADARLRRIWISDNDGRALFVLGGEVDAEELVVQRQASVDQNIDSAGTGITAFGSAVVDLAKVYISQASSAGMRLQGAANVTVSDFVIRATQRGSAAGDLTPEGVEIMGRASATLQRGLLDRNEATTILANGFGTRLEVIDTLIRDTQTTSNQIGLNLNANAVQVLDRARAKFVRSHFERHRALAAIAFTGSELVIEDGLIRSSLPQTGGTASAEGLLGHAVGASGGSSVELRRTKIEHAYTSALAIIDSGTTADLEDVVIHDVQSEVASGAGGYGVMVSAGARAELNRIYISDVTSAAVVALNEAEVEGSHVWVDGVSSPECSFTDEPCVFAVSAVASERDSTLNLSNCWLEGSEDHGVWVGDRSGLELAETTIVDALVGVSHHVDEEGLAIDVDTLEFNDIETEIEARDVPVGTTEQCFPYDYPFAGPGIPELCSP